MNARLYAKTAKTPKSPLRGQAERVWNELTKTPELATVISERITSSATPLVTRQDPYRVTLYYILVFKNQGLVAAHEPVVIVDDVPVVDDAPVAEVVAEVAAS